MRLKKKWKRGVAALLAGVVALTSVGVLNTQKTYAQLNVNSAYKILSAKDKWYKQYEREFSSYADGKKALTVDPRYGYQFIPTEKTVFSVTKGSNTPAPEQAVGGVTEPFIWFKTKNNTANNIQVKWSNLKIYQKDKGWLTVDLVRTVIKIQKHNGADTVSDSDCYIGLGKRPTELAYIGVEEVAVRNQFYLAGTNTTQALTTNITLTDIDRGQYIGVKTATVDGEYVSSDTKLSYVRSDNTDYYWADHNENLKSTPDSAVGFILNDSGFDYLFGKYRTYINNPTAVNDDIQYVGSGQLMVQIPPGDPYKTVSDNNETNVEHNTVEHLGDTWLYKVEQMIPYGMPSTFYYNDFSFEDQVEECMKIVDTSVYAEDINGVQHNLTNDFIITVDDNTVNATAKSNLLSSATFYSYPIIRLNVRVKMDIPENVTDSQYETLLAKWKEHGHYTETSTYNYIEEENTGKTIIDGAVRNSNTVSTNVALPKKFVSDDDETYVEHNDVRSLADSWVYNIVQPIDENLEDGNYYDSLSFTDDIEECLHIEKVEVVDASGKDVTSRFTITTTDNHVRATLSNPKNEDNYKTASYECRIHVKMYVPEGATEEQKEILKQKWLEHGHYTESKKIIQIENTAKVEIDGINALTNKVLSDIHLSTNKNEEPGLAIEKSVTPYESQVGDTVTYTVKVWNTNPKADTAYFTIKDTSLPVDMVVDKDSIKVDGIAAKNYTVEKTANGWVLNSVGDYKLPYGETITITYSATSQKTLNGTLVDNTAFTSAIGISEMSDIAQVYINSPKNDVVKTAEQKKYAIGDTVKYTVEITNRNAGTFMRDVVLNDVVETPGLLIAKDSVKVYAGNDDVTSKAEITYTEDGKGFDIKTPLNLYKDVLPVLTDACTNPEPYKAIENWTDKIIVTYDAVVTEEAALQNDLKNTFKAPATPNTNGDVIRDDENIPSGGGADDEQIPMDTPELKIVKSSDKETYEVGATGKYTLTVTQTKANLIAVNVVIKDAFDQTEGLEIDADSIKVYFNDSEVTDNCTITTEETNFGIATGLNLSDKDTIKVTYDVTFTKTGNYTNTAITSSDNTPTSEDDNVVNVKEPEPETPEETTTKAPTVKPKNPTPNTPSTPVSAPQTGGSVIPAILLAAFAVLSALVVLFGAVAVRTSRKEKQDK